MINFKFDIDLNLKGKTKILDKSQIHEILKNFDQFGILRFKNLTSKPENLIKFTDLFSKSYSNDAARRSKRLDSEKIRNVDVFRNLGTFWKFRGPRKYPFDWV